MMKQFNFRLVSIILLTAVFLCPNPASAKTRTVPMELLANPGYFIVDGGHMYVVEGVSVYVYSLKDFKLIRKFGKQGNGPQEFQVRPQAQYPDVDIKILPDRLQVNSIFKISFFDKEGNYLSEIKPKAWAWMLAPLGDYLAGRRTIADNNIRYHVVNLYDKEMKLVKELYREKDFFQPNQKLSPVTRKPAKFYSYKDVLIIADQILGNIHLFDNQGNKITSISHNFKKVPFAEKDRKAFIDFYLADPIIKPQFEATKHLLVWPDYFPFIWDHLTADDTIYVLTREQDKGKFKFYLFDFNTKKFKGTVLFPLKQMHAELPYPFTIHRNILYQMVETPDGDGWNLEIRSFN